MSKLTLNIGNTIYFDDQEYKILKQIDFKNILSENITTGEKKLIPISKISSNPTTPTETILNYSEHINEKDWQEALHKYKIIEPLLIPTRTRKMIDEIAKENNIHSATIYRWIQLYETTGTTSSLAPKYRGRGGKGKPRTDENTEAIIKDTIETLYLNKQRYSMRKVYLEIKIKCTRANLPVPHENTIRNRIKNLPQQLTVKTRYGKNKFNSLYKKIENEFPEGKYPLDVIQIDHTPLDIMIVDEVERKSIGRPYITLAMDIYSRTVFGFYLSFDHPSFFTVGQALFQGIQLKNNFLKILGIDGEWNVWGIPRVIHVDNAKEFRGKNLQRFCEEYGITLSWRPVARPEYGGHIERLLGTLSKEIHSLPGTTFSNISDKGEYNSEAKAIMTIDECEKWITNLIVNIYHQKIHSKLNIDFRKNPKDN